jgi:hypothetical protein
LIWQGIAFENPLIDVKFSTDFRALNVEKPGPTFHFWFYPFHHLVFRSFVPSDRGSSIVVVVVVVVALRQCQSPVMSSPACRGMNSDCITSASVDCVHRRDGRVILINERPPHLFDDPRIPFAVI